MTKQTPNQTQRLVSRTNRVWMTILLCLFSLVYVVLALETDTLLILLTLLCLGTAYLCWRGDHRGYALAVALAGLGLFGDLLFLALNVLGFFGPNLAVLGLVVYGVLQIPLGYFGLKAYKGSIRWPIVLIIIGSLLISSSYINNTARSYLAPAIDISHPQVTTIAQILAGKFPSALDKFGTNGTVVEVTNLTVVAVFGALDGDWHVVVNQTALKYSFITEILPSYQARLHAPVVGARIMMIGIVFWDDAHVKEAWHGYTGWEIHPVLAWSAI